jgi:hypothetical protein
MQARDNRLLNVKHRYIDEKWDLSDHIHLNANYHILSVDVLTYYVHPTILSRIRWPPQTVFYLTGINYFPFYGAYNYPGASGKYTILG